MNTWTKMLITGVGIMAAIVNAQTEPSRVEFTNFGYGNNWETAENWSGNSVPGESDAAAFRNSATARLTTSTTVAALQLGENKPGQLIVDGGELTVTGNNSRDGYWSIVGYTHDSSLTIQNHGSITIREWLSVGRKGNGKLIIYEGTLRVEKKFCHHLAQLPSQSDFMSRTTLYAGGLLDTNALDLNGGVMDIAGGTLIVRNNVLDLIQECVADGRIIAMGGKNGWEIQATIDANTGWTQIIAVSKGSESEPISVGMRCPDLFTRARFLL